MKNVISCDQCGYQWETYQEIEDFIPEQCSRCDRIVNFILAGDDFRVNHENQTA